MISDYFIFRLWQEISFFLRNMKTLLSRFLNMLTKNFRGHKEVEEKKREEKIEVRREENSWGLKSVQLESTAAEAKWVNCILLLAILYIVITALGTPHASATEHLFPLGQIWDLLRLLWHVRSWVDPALKYVPPSILFLVSGSRIMYRCTAWPYPCVWLD